MNHTEDAETEDGMPKIDRNGRVSYEADAAPPAVVDAAAEVAEVAEATPAAPVAEPAPVVPEAESVPVAPPARTPPRRAAPPAVPRE